MTICNLKHGLLDNCHEHLVQGNTQRYGTSAFYATIGVLHRTGTDERLLVVVGSIAPERSVWTNPQ